MNEAVMVTVLDRVGLGWDGGYDAYAAQVDPPPNF